jgi:hypothetical protein
MRRKIYTWLAIPSMLLAAVAGRASGQENLPFGPSNYEHDFQLFAPLELDLDNSQEDQYSGYYFQYQKLFWSYSGERVMVGDPNVVQLAEEIYRQNAQDEGTITPPYQIQNGLTDVPPDAGFASGNRYEFGYRDADNGWTIGILDWPLLNQGRFYGFARNIIPTGGGLPPFIDTDYTPGDDIFPPNGVNAGGDLRAFGFGSVPVLFKTPPGYLFGFRDYLENVGDAAVGTQGGPLLYVGNYGMVGPADFDYDDGEVDFFRLADDIDQDGIFGSLPIIVLVPDGLGGLVPSFAVIHDFDDLHEFNVFFDSVLVHNATQTDGVEAMWTHVLTNNHYMAKHQNNEVSFSWGARYLKVYDEFNLTMLGSVLHDVFVDTSFTNQIVGPQVSLRWVNRRQRWTLDANGRFMFGYNQADWDQLGLMGRGLVPGGLNQGLYTRATAFSHGLTERQFSPVAEMRLQAQYNFTRSFSMKFGYTGAFIGNIKRAAPSVDYFLPSFGYNNAGTQDLLVNGFDIGVEFVH